MSISDSPTGRGAVKGKQANPATPPKQITADFIPQPSADFVITPSIQDLTDRALAYLSVGYAVHLSGPAGTGKTTLALHIASQLARPCTMLHGDDELKGSDLVGRDSGYRRQSIRDNYVSSILKTEETVSVMWTNNRLTTACEQGHTLVYDEFTRSPATANNILLSVLEEGILNIPSSSQEKGYIKVHPDFRAIFTSNPEEYVGVHKTQDALLDRMITLEVSHQDRDTELAIVEAKSKRSHEDASIIVDIIRNLRDRLGGNGGPTIRAALAIATIADFRGCRVDASDPVFIATCQDLLYYNAIRQSPGGIKRQDIDAIVKRLATKSTRYSAANSAPTAAVTNADTLSSHDAVNVVRRVELALGNVTTKLNGLQEQIAAEVAVATSIELPGLHTPEDANPRDVVAPSALSNKNVAEPKVEERFAGAVNLSDESVETDSLRSTLNRQLPKPPSHDGSKTRVPVRN
jgi:gas vesicle protein GvpN